MLVKYVEEASKTNKFKYFYRKFGSSYEQILTIHL